jgi:plastocyanin
VALLLLLLALGGGTTSNPVLVGKVGLHNAYTITLQMPDGKPVTSIPAGTYSILVYDYSKIHNFALGSITDNKRIFTGGVRTTGRKTYTVDLTPGSYAYACSAHPFTMNGKFTVTAVDATTTTTP